MRLAGQTRSTGQRAGTRAVLLVLTAALLLISAERACAAEGGGAVVTGVVRDAQGLVQIGALVQVLTGDARTVATAFTDEHGHYSIRNLIPGQYEVKASATMFVPATRANLRLQDGARAVVNLTMAALFDTASWLPASRRRANEPDDGWKWTLRSAANRPILRVLGDDDQVVVLVPDRDGTRAAKRWTGRAELAGETGVFGGGAVQTGVTLHGVLTGGADGTFRAVVGTANGVGMVSSTGFSAGYGTSGGMLGGESRTVVSLRSAPQLMTGDGESGLQVAEIRTGRRTTLGESVELEAGSSAEAVHTGAAVAGSYALAAHPFVRLTASPAAGWRLQYRLATARDAQEFADVVAGEDAMPVASVSGGKLMLERGRHQEISAARKAGRTVMEVALYHDAIDRAAVMGGVLPGVGAGSFAGLTGLTLDPVSGTFQTAGNGFVADGARFTLSADLSRQIWLAAEYATGAALSLDENAAPSTAAAAVSGMKARSSEAAAVALRAKLGSAGPVVRAAYRWQPAGTLTAVDAYGALSDQAFLSCVVRQHLSWKNYLPQGLDAKIDVTNLLAQGYRPYVSADGQTLYFAQAPRTVQAGLSFTF